MSPRDTIISDESLAEIAAQFGPEGDGVWVAPDFARAHGITAADEHELAQALARTDVEVRVLFTDVPDEDDRFAGSIDHLTAWIQDDVGGEALYLVWSGSFNPEVAVLGEVDVMPEGLWPAELDAAAMFPRDPHNQALHVVHSMDGTRQADGEVGAQSTGLGFDAVAGVLAALGLCVAARLLGIWREARSDSARGSGGAHRRFVMPARVLRRVRAAEDRDLIQTAQSEAAVLGSALVEQDLSVLPGDALGVWQSAMEHHELAVRLMARSGEAADVVGAIVLVRRGESARRAAVAAQAWEPRPECWFNPLHLGPTSPALWRDPERSQSPREVEVPSCQACATALRAGREPGDILDFVRAGKSVHHFRADLGVWGATGFGALEPDLVGALHRGGRRLT